MNTGIYGISIILILSFLTSVTSAAESYEVEYSTYAGGSGYEHIRDICADKQGNVYITGGTTSPDYPTTPGVYQQTHGGMFDIFVTKFSPTGDIIWSTLVGGKDYDRAYAIEVDDQGYVYVGGRGGRDAPITSGVVQETFKGQWAGGPYKSDMNAYVFKLSPDGSRLIWATYFGTGEKFRDIDIDKEGNVYGVWHDPLNPENPHKDTWREESWFANAFQKEPQGGEGDFGVVKISSDGTRCVWATYLTGSGKETGAGSVRVDDEGYVYAETWTFSSDMPTTPGAYDRTHNGEADYYVARLTPDGSELVFGTYLGGSKQEIHSTHNLAIDQHGNSYVSVWTSSPDFPTTPGAFQRVYRGDYSDWAVAKFSPNGALIASTLIGGSEGENPDGIYVDAAENVYISGYTRSTDFPVTVEAHQVRDGQKGAIVKLSADFSQLLYSSYMNGSKRDDLRASFLGADGNWYVGGESGSVDWPTKGAFQESFAGQGDCIVVSLKPAIAETMEGNTKYEVAFSTYLGGSRGEDTARAVAVDREGYIYVTGGTQSPDFPVTEGALDTTFATGGLSLGARGAMDVFVTKLDPKGGIVWSTYLGGANYDRAYSVRVDKAGNVYVAGRAGEGFPITPGVIQENFAGDSNPPGAYGKQDGFITKLSADGSKILWSTYFGDSGGSIIRDIDIDDDGNIYITLMGVSVPSPYITAGAFQAELSGGRDNVIAKLSSDGSRIIWASYLGGSGNDIAPSIRVDADGYVYVDGSTTSADFPVTENAYQTVHAGSEDAFVAKFRPDGSGLEYATFLGGSQSDGAAGKHGLAVDEAGHAYVVGFTSSSDFPTTAGAFQTRYAGGMKGNWEQTGDRFIAKISPNGNRLLASTFVGGDQRDGGEGIAVDDQGRVYLSTFSYSNDFPVNDDAMQRENAEPPDGVAFILGADFSYAELSTYMGGSGNDNFRACAVGTDGSFVIVGSTNSRDWPVRNAMQPTFGGGSGDVIVVRFSPGNP